MQNSVSFFTPQPVNNQIQIVTRSLSVQPCLDDYIPAPSVHSIIQYGIIISMNPNIIGVRFTKVGKIYHFDTSAVPDVGLGEHVIVDTSRGKHLGEVVQIIKDAP